MFVLQSLGFFDSVKTDNNTKEEKTLPSETSHEIELLMKLIEEQSKRLDDQKHHMENITKIITRYKDEVEKIWQVINAKGEELVGVHDAITGIRNGLQEVVIRQVDMRASMEMAADRKDITLLKKVIEG